MSERRRHLDEVPPIPGTRLVASQMRMLTDWSFATFNQILNRRQLPLGPVPNAPEFLIAATRPDIPERWRDWADRRGYSPMCAFAAVVAAELFRRFGLERDRAAEAAVQTLKITPAQWATISRNSASPGIYGKTPVMLGIFARDGSDTFGYEIGTAKEFAERFVYSKGSLMLNLTACARLLRERAKEHGIKLDGFFAE